MGNWTVAPTLRLDADAPSWEDAKAVGRAAYRETLRPVDGLLNPTFAQQAAFLHLAGIRTPGTGQDHRNHVVHGMLKMADDLWMPKPAICDLGGEIIEIDAFEAPALVDRILDGWPSFRGATFVPLAN
ncbi:hypothetical protein [Microvirga ossetica]|nr:hypothetical protein [Microvirga ossetica]